RYDNGAFSATYVSPDLVEELRIIVAPADAETGRGSGQVQMVTRAGTNQFRGSVFYTNRNSALSASNWFNNFNGVGKNYQNCNQSTCLRAIQTGRDSTRRDGCRS